MKATILSLALVAFFATSCSQNEKPQSSAPADYEETYDDLIQNRKDSTSENSTAPNDGPSVATDSAAQEIQKQ